MRLPLPAHGHKLADWDNPMTFVWVTGAALIAATVVAYAAEALSLF